MEGDAALIEAADILREVFRESDIIGRIGGDEFVILAVDSDGSRLKPSSIASTEDVS